MAKVAINGLGRIGRATLKILLDTPELELVAANEVASAENVAYLLKYDTVYGRLGKSVLVENGFLNVGGHRIRLLNEKDPAKLPWGELGVDVIFECTGVFKKKADLSKHLQAGAKAVILSAPTKEEEIMTVVHGVNAPDEGHMQIISCASCTTNCITPVVEIIGRRLGIQKATMTTIHAYTASQSLVDGPDKQVRRGRAGAANFVPASTGAAIATTKALPQYKGLFNGIAVRGPVPVGSLADVVLLTSRKTSVEEVNRIFREEAADERYREVLAVSEDPIVSSDIIQDSHAAVIDMTSTQVVDGDLVKVFGWYDNEWGYSCQMVREGVQLSQSLEKRFKKAG